MQTPPVIVRPDYRGDQEGKKVEVAQDRRLEVESSSGGSRDGLSGVQRKSKDYRKLGDLSSKFLRLDKARRQYISK